MNKLILLGLVFAGMWEFLKGFMLDAFDKLIADGKNIDDMDEEEKLAYGTRLFAIMVPEMMEWAICAVAIVFSPTNRLRFLILSIFAWSYLHYESRKRLGSYPLIRSALWRLDTTYCALVLMVAPFVL